MGSTQSVMAEESSAAPINTLAAITLNLLAAKRHAYTSATPSITKWLNRHPNTR